MFLRRAFVSFGLLPSEDDIIDCMQLGEVSLSSLLSIFENFVALTPFTWQAVEDNLVIEPFTNDVPSEVMTTCKKKKRSKKVKDTGIESKEQADAFTVTDTGVMPEQFMAMTAKITELESRLQLQEIEKEQMKAKVASLQEERHEFLDRHTDVTVALSKEKKNSAEAELRFNRELQVMQAENSLIKDKLKAILRDNVQMKRSLQKRQAQLQQLKEDQMKESAILAAQLGALETVSITLKTPKPVEGSNTVPPLEGVTLQKQSVKSNKHEARENAVNDQIKSPITNTNKASFTSPRQALRML
jgi:hypothetical protein